MSRTMRGSLAALSLIAAARAMPAAADLTKAGDAEVVFQAAGPADLKIEGKTAEVQVAGDGQVLKVGVPLGGLSTGIGLRDRHMRDALEVGKFPTAELAVKRDALKVPGSGSESKASVSGTLTLHGQSRPVTIEYTARNDGPAHRVKGSMKINMTDFGVTPPKYLGVAVKPDVAITATFRVSAGAGGAPQAQAARGGRASSRE